MNRWLLALVVSGSTSLFLPGLAHAADEAAKGTPKGTLATTESTLKSAGEQIRALAFDGDDQTAFVSEGNAQASDSFTLKLEAPTAVKKIRVMASGPDGKDALKAGRIEISSDGQAFSEVGKIVDGIGEATLEATPVKAVRISPAEDVGHPLVVREISLDSEPKVEKFSAPVEFILDSTDAPELADWLTGVGLACERAYPMICAELKGDGHRPARVIRITLSNDYKGVAAASGNRIVGSVNYYRNHKDDVGSMVHETAHVVQAYRRRGSPGWLVEGIADYVRFVKYEPQNIGPINAQRAHYNDSYRTSARFLDYVSKTYDKELVLKLNAACRAGEYRDELFEELTRKKLADLDAEWRESLK